MAGTSARDHDPALGLLRVLREDGRTDPATDPFLAPETLLAMYKEMRRSRALDTALIERQRSGRIGFWSAALGQEAVAVGAVFALDAADWVFPTHRETSALLCRGVSVTRVVSQAFGTGEDPLHGRQTPGHGSSRSALVASPPGAVGTQLPQAVGVAMAAKRRGSRIAVLAFVGDGGTSTPDFHSAMNFAGVFRAPCIVVCQNNQVAVSTGTAAQTASSTFAVKGHAYGVPGVRVDGTDVLAVHRAIAEARVRAVAGAGPTLVECVTRRASPYVAAGAEPDPAAAPTEIEGDPIGRFQRHLEYIGALDAEAEASIVAVVTAEVDAAIAHAEASAPPDRETLFDDVYAARPWNLVEQAGRADPLSGVDSSV
ncbi:MAG TPA: thiamine pyrophosphate-dependent enzyme [Polyangiaceae bacterium]|nr:thiamine pyrophosphate-dependent enzyme [Polyangiaceae bacterium]